MSPLLSTYTDTGWVDQLPIHLLDHFEYDRPAVHQRDASSAYRRYKYSFLNSLNIGHKLK